MAKKVYKYGTGHPIPEGAVYLSTKVETVQEYEYIAGSPRIHHIITNNVLVWHYFLVEVDE